MATTTPEHYGSTNEARINARAALVPRQIGSVSSRWDNLVSVLRLVLPASAGLLASAMLIWPFLSSTEASFTLSQDEVADGDGRVRMTNLEYVGTDSKDRLFTIRASEGEQIDPSDEVVSLTEIGADMALSSKMPLSVVADTGFYRLRNESLELAQVILTIGPDYRLDMRSARIDLKARTVTGDADIVGLSPLGRISADQLSVKVDDRIGTFKGRVRMQITPRRTLPQPAPKSGEE